MISNYWEIFREWLAWKIFPELGMYIKVIKRFSAMEENDRIVKLLEEADSVCSGWAVDVVKIKYKTLDLNSITELLGDASEDQKS